MKNKKICHSAIEKYGARAQAGQTMEECGELIVAIHKYFFRENGGDPDNLAGEIADVEIMCLQMRMILDDRGYGGKVDEAKRYKLDRLQVKIKRRDHEDR